MDETSLLDIREVATYLNVPRATLYRWRCQGVGPPGYKVGRHVRYRSAEVEAWLRDRADKPGSAVG